MTIVRGKKTDVLGTFVIKMNDIKKSFHDPSFITRNNLKENIVASLRSDRLLNHLNQHANYFQSGYTRGYVYSIISAYMIANELNSSASSQILPSDIQTFINEIQSNDNSPEGGFLSAPITLTKSERESIEKYLVEFQTLDKKSGKFFGSTYDISAIKAQINYNSSSAIDSTITQNTTHHCKKQNPKVMIKNLIREAQSTPTGTGFFTNFNHKMPQSGMQCNTQWRSNYATMNNNTLTISANWINWASNKNSRSDTEGISQELIKLFKQYPNINEIDFSDCALPDLDFAIILWHIVDAGCKNLTTISAQHATVTNGKGNVQAAITQIKQYYSNSLSAVYLNRSVVPQGMRVADVEIILNDESGRGVSVHGGVFTPGSSLWTDKIDNPYRRTHNVPHQPKEDPMIKIKSDIAKSIADAQGKITRIQQQYLPISEMPTSIPITTHPIPTFVQHEINTGCLDLYNRFRQEYQDTIPSILSELELEEQQKKLNDLNVHNNSPITDNIENYRTQTYQALNEINQQIKNLELKFIVYTDIVATMHSCMRHLYDIAMEKNKFIMKLQNIVNSTPESYQLSYNWNELNNTPFVEFINRIDEIADLKPSSSEAVKNAAKEQLAKIIIAMDKNKHIREACINEAIASLGDCGDALNVGFLKMQLIATKCNYSDRKLSTIFNNCRILGKLHYVIEVIIKNKIDNIPFNADHIEVQLKYLKELKQQLDIVINCTLYGTPYVNENDIVQAKTQLAAYQSNEDNIYAVMVETDEIKKIFDQQFTKIQEDLGEPNSDGITEGELLEAWKIHEAKFLNSKIEFLKNAIALEKKCDQLITNLEDGEFKVKFTHILALSDNDARQTDLLLMKETLENQQQQLKKQTDEMAEIKEKINSDQELFQGCERGSYWQAINSLGVPNPAKFNMFTNNGQLIRQRDFPQFKEQIATALKTEEEKIALLPQLQKELAQTNERLDIVSQLLEQAQA